MNGLASRPYQWLFKIQTSLPALKMSEDVEQARGAGTCWAFVVGTAVTCPEDVTCSLSSCLLASVFIRLPFLQSSWSLEGDGMHVSFTDSTHPSLRILCIRNSL